MTIQQIVDKAICKVTQETGDTFFIINQIYDELFITPNRLTARQIRNALQGLKRKRLVHTTDERGVWVKLDYAR